jgi:hypothetical protein
VTLLPENQLIQARALVQDIRAFMREQTKGHHPMMDYRMVDVFRGLELAHKGLTALIDNKQYTEFEQLQEAFKNWPEMDMTDESLGEG